MRRSFVLSVCLFLGMGAQPADQSQDTRKLSAVTASMHEAVVFSRPKSFSCLPKAVQANEAVAYGPRENQRVTVVQKLVEMKARCRNGKLVDARDREIRFFRPSCWGNPPPDYLEIREREDAELLKLRERYTVVVIACNPMIQ